MGGLLSFLTGGGIGAINGIIRTIFGSKQERDQAVHEEQSRAMDAQAAEFQFRGQRYFFDALIDGLNRLPRPLAALGFLGLFAYAAINPIEFQIIMVAYSAVPEWLALIFAQIMLMFFGGRLLGERWSGNMKARSSQEFKQTLGQIQELRELQTGERKVDGLTATPITAPYQDDMKASRARGERVTDDEFDAEMADENKPLSNASIAEWNRRHNPNFKQ